MAILWSIIKHFFVCNSTGCSTRTWTSPSEVLLSLSAPFCNSFPYPSSSILSYSWSFLEIHTLVSWPVFKPHFLMLYYLQIQVQQWKYDLHAPFLWKHHPQLGLTANHLQVCLYFLYSTYMVEVTVLKIHWHVKRYEVKTADQSLFTKRNVRTVLILFRSRRTFCAFSWLLQYSS